MENHSIYAVVISFNPNIALLDAEYNSIAPQVKKIIYVDNFSKNREAVRDWGEKKNKAIVLYMNDNEGIGAAQNVGIRTALKEGASHVILFDQDSVVENNFVEELYNAEQRALNAGINVGITGPIYKSHDDNYAYPILSIENNKFTKIPVNSFSIYKEVSHIIASGELIRREVFEKIGLMREDYFIEYVDFEYSFRAAKYGYKTIVTKNACMNHQMGDNQIMVMGRKIGIYSPFRRYFTCRNSILIQRENIFPKVFRRHYLKLAIGKFMLSWIFGPNRLKQLKYCLKGWYDGILNNSGKCTIAR